MVLLAADVKMAARSITAFYSCILHDVLLDSTMLTVYRRDGKRVYCS